MRTFIIILLGLAVVSCGETYQERLDQYHAKMIAEMNDREKEVGQLRDKCADDEKPTSKI